MRFSSAFAGLLVALVAGSSTASPLSLIRDDATSLLLPRADPAANTTAPAAASPSGDELTTKYNAFLAQFRNSTLTGDVFKDEWFQRPSSPSVESQKPGALLKIQKVTGDQLAAFGKDLPMATTLWRIMYVSVDYKGDKVPATGFVMAPYIRSSKTVAWAHGTSGITRECAPSNQKELYYGWSAMFQLVAQGYNVVAPDYAGQGSDSGFHYVEAVTHAYDVSNAVKAAQGALPELKIKDWAVVGHSEGGLTAWSTTEYESNKQGQGAAPNFLGGVSMAPSMDPREINQRVLATPESRAATEKQGSVFYTINVFESIRRIMPSLKPENYLTDLGQQYLQLYLSGGCLPAAASFFGSASMSGLWKDFTWPKTKEAYDWSNLIRAQGKDKLTKPLLVLQGDSDEAVWPTINHETFQRHCDKFGNKSPIQYVSYKGVLHAPIMHAASPRWFAFLDDLFAGRKPARFENCRTVNVTGVEVN